MSGSAEPGVPAAARVVLVVGSASAGDATCASLSARGDRVLFVGYGDSTADAFRDRLAWVVDAPPPVRGLGVGEDVEAGDLTGQGIAVAEAFSPETAVCLDGIDVLLEDLDREPVFQFVHSLAERCAQAGATMHLHVDPDAVDDRAVAALSTLMDAVVHLEDDDVTVRPELTEKD